MKQILVIQTAFIGDVILATSLIESLRQAQPDLEIDFVLRKGNESLLQGNPNIRKIYVWDKKQAKYRNLFKTIREIREHHYDAVINLQRFMAAGIIALRTRSERRYGFKSGWWSWFYTKGYPHTIGDGKHETERNFDLLAALGKFQWYPPKLYPTPADAAEVDALKIEQPYVVMAPSSVWYTKQLPENKWIELMEKTAPEKAIYLIGAPGDQELLDRIKQQVSRPQVYNLAGKLSLLASAHLMRGAHMTYVNDSAPLHLASAMNVPVTAFFCSTIPAFGFGPLSAESRIVEVGEKLDCRPCGLHGYKACPKGHFDCGNKIRIFA